MLFRDANALSIGRGSVRGWARSHPCGAPLRITLYPVGTVSLTNIPRATGTGSEAGGTSLLSGMVGPGGGMRSRAHLGHLRAAGLCADDRAIRSGPHCSLGRHEAGLYVSPDRDQQLTSEGDDGDTLDAPGGGADAVAIPARQRALGLMTYESLMCEWHRGHGFAQPYG